MFDAELCNLNRVWLSRKKTKQTHNNNKWLWATEPGNWIICKQWKFQCHWLEFFLFFSFLWEILEIQKKIIQTSVNLTTYHNWTALYLISSTKLRSLQRGFCLSRSPNTNTPCFNNPFFHPFSRHYISDWWTPSLQIVLSLCIFF